MRIYIDVERCDSCPFVLVERTQGAGYAVDYLCGKKNEKEIAGYVEWDDELPSEPPAWCPFREQNSAE